MKKLNIQIKRRTIQFEEETSKKEQFRLEKISKYYNLNWKKKHLKKYNSECKKDSRKNEQSEDHCGYVFLIQISKYE